MAFVIHTSAIIAASVVFGLSVFLALEIAAALLPAGVSKCKRRKPGPVAVIIPAHNESKIIGATLESVKAQLRANDKMLVVADNCTDATAAIAKDHGAEVMERTDTVRRGKGYALQFALDAMKAAPPEIVVFIDADCILADNMLARICALAAGENRPVQALYLMKAPVNASPRLQVAAFAWLFINQVRMLGLQRLFDVTRFTGAGLALPWQAVSTLNLASGEIVEDLALTFELTKNGYPPLLASDALITSEFPQAEEALVKQSARWSIGSLAYAARSGFSWLGKGIVQGRPQLIGAAIDLMAPPLTVFLLCIICVMMISGVSWAFGSSTAIILSSMALVLTGAGVATGWARYGRNILPVAAFAGVFHFALSKLSVFGSQGRKSAKVWTPTRSENHDDA